MIKCIVHRRLSYVIIIRSFGGGGGPLHTRAKIQDMKGLVSRQMPSETEVVVGFHPQYAQSIIIATSSTHAHI